MKNRKSWYLGLAIIMFVAAVADLLGGIKGSRGLLTFAGACFLIACISFACAYVHMLRRDSKTDEGEGAA